MTGDDVAPETDKHRERALRTVDSDHLLGVTRAEAHAMLYVGDQLRRLADAVVPMVDSVRGEMQE